MFQIKIEYKKASSRFSKTTKKVFSQIISGLLGLKHFQFWKMNEALHF